VAFTRVVARAGEAEPQRVASVDDLDLVSESNVERALPSFDPDQNGLDGADELMADRLVALARRPRRQQGGHVRERLEVGLRRENDR